MNTKEYVDNSRTEGKKVVSKYANKFDYLFIYEFDGWISIVDVTGGNYRMLIRAADEAHAISYITRREPIPVPVNFI